MPSFARWRNVTSDQAVSRHPALLHGVILLTKETGGDATIYEGQGAVAANKIVQLQGGSGVSLPVYFDPPLACQRGIYVDIGGQVLEVLVHFTPLPLNYTFV